MVRRCSTLRSLTEAPAPDPSRARAPFPAPRWRGQAVQMTSPAGTLRFADRYRVVRRLGTGGMATVYLAEDERLGRRVAVKRLHADSPEDVALRFEREARIGASLNHPALVAVYDTLTDPEGVLIVMEYVDGPTLAQVLRDGPLPIDRALAVLREVGAALDHAHRHGVVHRDLKPANILLTEEGGAKLADLGIALAAERVTKITRTGTVLGTPSYMPPEQLEGRDVGPPADIYALGAVAFEALSGRKARTGGTPVEIAHRIATEPAPELREAWPEAPEAAGEALCAGMAAEPARRPRSAGELVEWLATALAGVGERSSAALAASAGPSIAAAGAAAGSATDEAAVGAAPEAAPSGDAGAGAAPAGADRSGFPADAASPEPPATSAGAPPSEPKAPPREPPAPPTPAAGTGPASRAAASPPSRPHAPVTSRRRTRAWLAPAALVAVLALVVAVGAVLLGGQGGGREGGSTADRRSPGAAERGTVTGGEETPGDAAAPAAPPAAGDPAATVKAFYERGAAGDYQGAWSLAGPGFRRQLGGFESFRGGMSTLESVDFGHAETLARDDDSAEVAIETQATHSNRVDRCQGTLSLARGGPSGWSISGGNIACSSGGGAAAGRPAGGGGR
jgi:serine/threonine protein kinase